MKTEIKLMGMYYALDFNNYALEAFARLFDIDPLKAGEKAQALADESMLAIAGDMVYSGIVGNLRARREAVPVTAAGVAALIADDTELSSEELAGVIRMFIETLNLRAVIPTEKKTIVKGRKSNGKKSKITR